MTLSYGAVCGSCLPNLQLSALPADSCEVESISRPRCNPIVPLLFCRSIFLKNYFYISQKKTSALQHWHWLVPFVRERIDRLRLLFSGKAVAQTIKAGGQLFCPGTGVGPPHPIIQPTTQDFHSNLHSIHCSALLEQWAVTNSSLQSSGYIWSLNHIEVSLGFLF